MTRDQANKMKGLINVLAEAEREYIRSKLAFSSRARRDKRRRMLEYARRNVADFIHELEED